MNSYKLSFIIIIISGVFFLVLCHVLTLYELPDYKQEDVNQTGDK